MKLASLLRKNRGTKMEGYAIFEEAWFTSAKFEVQRKSWDFRFWLQRSFSWIFEKAGSALPRRKTARLSAPAPSETVLDYAI
jgi:hypothetical protein